MMIVERLAFVLLITFQFYFSSHRSNKQRENRESAGKPIYHRIKYFKFLYFFQYKDNVLEQEWAMQFAVIVLWIVFAMFHLMYVLFGLEIVLFMDIFVCIAIGLTVSYIAILCCRYSYNLYFANNTDHKHDFICEMKESFGMHPRRKCKVIAFHGTRQDESGECYRIADVTCSKKVTIYHVWIYDNELLVGDVTKVFRDDLNGRIKWVVF